MKKTFLIILSLLQAGCAGDSYYYQNNQKVSLYPYSSSLRSSLTIDYYQNEKGILLGVTDKLIVKLKADQDIDTILQKYDLSLEKTLGANLFVLKVNDKKLTIDTANRLKEEDAVEYAQPDFIKQRISR